LFTGCHDRLPLTGGENTPRKPLLKNSDTF
jgi:hypothetical protein